MRIHLVRHGQTERNLLRCYSRENEDLNEKGIEQAYELKMKTDEIPYQICFCSPLARAVHTAEILTEGRDTKIVVDGLLHGRDPGALDGKPFEFTDRNEYWNYYTKVDYGAESIPELFHRIYRFIDSLKDGKKYDDVLVVAHSGVSKAFYSYFNGVPEDGNLLNVGLKNCEVVTYELEQRRF